MIDNCKDCPATCLGFVISADCVEYNGEKLSNYLNGGTVSEETTDSTSTQLSSNDIISKSLIRNTSGVCSSKIINRTITHKLSTTQTTTTFGWDFLKLISDLPSGYEAALSSITVTGKGGNGRSNVIAQSKSPSSGVGVRVDQYPLTVDFLIRVSSPCGDVDLKKTIRVLSSTNTGEHSTVLDAVDLNPISGEVSLTEQLDNLEAQVIGLGQKVETIGNPSSSLAEQNLKIDQIEEEVKDPSSFTINYVADGGNKSATISQVISDLYLQIANMGETIASQEIEISSLRAQLNAL